MTVCLGRLRSRVYRSIYSLNAATDTTISDVATDTSCELDHFSHNVPVSKRLSIPQQSPKWIIYCHLLSTLLLVSICIYWFIYYIEPQSQLSPIFLLAKFFGISQLLYHHVATTRFLILVAWLLFTPIAIYLIHWVANPLQSTTTSLLSPNMRFLKVVARKMYHIVCVIAFLPVLVVFNETLLLACACLIGIGILVVLETLRASGLPSQKLSCSVNNFMER